MLGKPLIKLDIFSGEIWRLRADPEAVQPQTSCAAPREIEFYAQQGEGSLQSSSDVLHEH
jgi:hypothetical protein